MFHYQQFEAGHPGLKGYRSYLVWDDETRAGFLVDAVMPAEPILLAINEHELTVTDLLQTHGRYAQVQGQPVFRNAGDLMVYMHPEDEFWLRYLDVETDMLGIPGLMQVWIDQQVDHESEIRIAPFEITALHIPGYTPGGTCYYVPAMKALFSGAILHADGIGQPDGRSGSGLPYASEPILKQMVQERLLGLPDDTKVLPAKGEPTTIGDVKAQLSAAKS